MGKSILSTDEQVRSIWHLGGLSGKQLLLRVWNGLNRHNILGRAAELAYNFILSVFPLFIFLLSLFGLYANRGNQLRANLLFYLNKALPPQAYAMLSKTIAEITRNSGA